MTTNKQNTKTWTDEKGNQVPAQYVPTYDKKKTYAARKLSKEARQLQERIMKFKNRFQQVVDELYSEFIERFDIDQTTRKGNFTFTSFDGNIKVEVDVNELIRFEDDKVQAAHAKLQDFKNRLTINDEQEFIIQIINRAFETSNGQLDARKVLDLTKYRKTIKGKENSRLYNEAMDLLEQSITRPDSKRYMRIYEKDKDGKYQPIVLNFSAL